jgi:hypothetical protein
VLWLNMTMLPVVRRSDVACCHELRARRKGFPISEHQTTVPARDLLQVLSFSSYQGVAVVVLYLPRSEASHRSNLAKSLSYSISLPFINDQVGAIRGRLRMRH